ncbi:unnamed protein product, partial [Ranitomeya imitator]
MHPMILFALAAAAWHWLLQHVVRLHGIPENIVSDRGSQFVSRFWRAFCGRMGIDLSFSSAFHPQTNGQTERTNQTLETYLRCFVSADQDDWVSFLPLAEFALNNRASSATLVSPFFCNSGFHPRFSSGQVESSDCPGVDSVVDRLQQIWTQVVDNLILSQEKAQLFANRRRRVGPRLRVGDLVWLSSRHIPMKVSSPKFKPRFIGPYRISEVLNPVSFRLTLPDSFSIHNVFHRSLLRRYVAPMVPSVEPPAPVLVEGELEYIVEKILDSRVSRRKLHLSFVLLEALRRKGCTAVPLVRHGKEAFIRLADLLNIRVITMKARMHPFECWMPHLYRSAASRFIRRVVLHKGFIYAFDVVILVNAIFIGLEDKIPLISNAEWVFLSLYVIEILLKLYTYDPRSFFAKSQFWNWFDTFIIIAALIATTVNTALKSVSQYTSQDILDIVFILRVLRLIRIIDSFQRFRVIMNTLINIFPTMLTFCGIILTIYYVFAIIGMEIFKNKIRFFPENSTDPYAQDCGAKALRDSSFAKSKYCKNNFNDLSSAFVVLVELTVVNHIFVAFILEAFFVEYSLEKSEVETAIEKKIQELGMAVQEEDIPARNLVDNMDNCENDLGGFDEENQKGLMFQIASKRYRTVDALLQRMFEAEIPPEDEGPPMEDIMNLSSNDLYIENPTFNSAA